MKVPEQYRIKKGNLASEESAGNNGAFKIPLSRRTVAFVLASDQNGWEHVSAHCISDNVQRTPTWAEMCRLKDMFWDEEEAAVQYHPAKKDYVNNHQHVLHIWRPTDGEFPKPDPNMVGWV